MNETGFRSIHRTRALGVSALLAGLILAAGCEQQATKHGQITKGSADRVLETLAQAPSHGFDTNAFPVAGLKEDLRSSDTARRNAALQNLRTQIIAYAEAQRGVSEQPSSANSKWGMKPDEFDAEASLDQALADGRLNAWLNQLPPPAPEYQALREYYDKYQKLAQAGGWPEVPDGPALKLGSTDPRVATLRARLRAEDPSVAESNAGFDAALAQAVSRFQARHGLKTTGEVDKPTLAALNVSATERVEQIRANLERWRWAPRERAPTRIEVNSAAGTMRLFSESGPGLYMLAASGKPGDETPILASEIHTVVLSPTWNVPASIANEELLPKGEDYLARNGFTAGESEEAPLVQEPGPDNALGLAKFQFDNRYSVYLHDTPAKAAFAKTQRQVSHGCVRLARAIDLAKALLAAEGWSGARVDETIASRETTNVKLTKKVPVAIYYWTAFVENGELMFRDDVYGWDRQSLNRLAASGAEPG